MDPLLCHLFCCQYHFDSSCLHFPSSRKSVEALDLLLWTVLSWMLNSFIFLCSPNCLPACRPFFPPFLLSSSSPLPSLCYLSLGITGLQHCATNGLSFYHMIYLCSLENLGSLQVFHLLLDAEQIESFSCSHLLRSLLELTLWVMEHKLFLSLCSLLGLSPSFLCVVLSQALTAHMYVPVNIQMVLT